MARRPPKIIALIGTPLGLSHSGESAGLLVAGEVKRARDVERAFVADVDLRVMALRMVRVGIEAGPGAAHAANPGDR